MFPGGQTCFRKKQAELQKSSLWAFLLLLAWEKPALCSEIKPVLQSTWECVIYKYYHTLGHSLNGIRDVEKRLLNNQMCWFFNGHTTTYGRNSNQWY